MLAPRITYTTHALARMSERSISKKAVVRALKFGVRTILKSPPAFIYTLDTLVIVLSKNGMVKTVYVTDT